MNKLDKLVGKSIERVYKADDDVYLVCADREVIRLRPEGDCCANCFIAGATLTNALTEATVMGTEDLEEQSEDKGDYEVVDTWAHRIHTSKGTCTLEMRTEHNGGWLNVDLDVEIPDGAKPLEDF